LTYIKSIFKEVLLNYPRFISKEYFKCQARVDNDEKIVCKIKLEHEVKIENITDFKHFTKNPIRTFQPLKPGFKKTQQFF
jgi:hypothetical protein